MSCASKKPEAVEHPPEGEGVGWNDAGLVKEVQRQGEQMLGSLTDLENGSNHIRYLRAGASMIAAVLISAFHGFEFSVPALLLAIGSFLFTLAGRSTWRVPGRSPEDYHAMLNHPKASLWGAMVGSVLDLRETIDMDIASMRAGQRVNIYANWFCYIGLFLLVTRA